MTNILLIRIDEMPFDDAAVSQIFSTQSGFQDVRSDNLVGAAVEARYTEPEDWTIVSLSEDRGAISLSGTSDAALCAALILQTDLKTPLRIFDTNYSFDLTLQNYSTVDELRAAIESRRRVDLSNQVEGMGRIPRSPSSAVSVGDRCVP